MRYHDLMTIKHAVNLERLGLSRRGSITVRARKLLGMNPKATHDEVIAVLQNMMDDIFTQSSSKTENGNKT